MFVLIFWGERYQKLIFLFCKHLKKLLLTLVLHFLHPLFLEFIILMLLLYDWFPNFLKFYLLFSTSFVFLFSLEDVTLFSNLSVEFLISAIMLLILKNSDLDSSVLLKKPLFFNKFTGSFQNTTKWPHVPFTQFPSMIIFYVNIVQYEKQNLTFV